jgi:hypothetical protein
MLNPRTNHVNVMIVILMTRETGCCLIIAYPPLPNVKTQLPECRRNSGTSITKLTTLQRAYREFALESIDAKRSAVASHRTHQYN